MASRSIKNKSLRGKLRLIWNPAQTVLAVLLIFFLSACTGATTASSPEANPSDIPSPTALPATATDLPPALLLLGSTASPYFDLIQNEVLEFTQNVGWRLTVEAHPPGDFTESEINMVIALGPDPGIGEMAAQYPAIQFLAIGIADLSPTNNLSILGENGYRQDRRAFLGGYIAAIMAPQWRVGFIHDAVLPQATMLEESFMNGMTFFCGLCNSVYPPFYEYPIYFPLADDENLAEWSTALDLMTNSATEIVYAFTQATPTSDLILQGGDELIWLGNSSPGADQNPTWAASIDFAPHTVLRDHWEQLQAGDGGWIAEIPLTLSNVNSVFISAGRQVWIEETIVALNNGWVEPLVSNPESAE
jgi:hypothetical protein